MGLKFKSLTLKVSLFVIAIMMVSLAVSSTIFVLTSRDEILQDIADNGKIFANFSTQTVYDNFVQFYQHPSVEDFENFRTNVEAVLEKNPDVIRTTIVGANGKILFDSEELKTGKYAGLARNIDVADTKTMEMLKSETVSYSNIYENGESVTEIMVPTKVSGIFVRYLLSNRSLSSKMSDVYTRIAYVSIILFVFTVLMGILFSVTITKPIIFLTKVVEQIRKGDFDAKVTVTSRDEIGRLGLAFNDMTDRLKKSYHEVSDEKARLLASINSLSMGFIIVDSNDAIILHNHSLLKILETETSPQNLIELTKHFSEFDLLDSCRRCIKLNQFVEVRNIPFRKKFLRVFCAPVESVGEIIGHVILMEDVTEARVLERGKEEFFAVASHELRTPLTAIRGNSEMILQMYSDKIVDKDMKDMVSDINIASIRLIDIVNEFLEVSRLEQGRIENKKEEFDMNEVITSSVNAAKAAANKKALSLEYIKPEVELPKVFADKNDTKHVLENLISNSIKFTNEGEITVKAEKENNFIKVSITDTGIGISDFNQPLLFRKFQQAGEKILARDASQGTGLGLYISQILLSNMGGAVKLEKSVLGHGSTFSFTIPVAV